MLFLRRSNQFMFIIINKQVYQPCLYTATCLLHRGHKTQWYDKFSKPHRKYEGIDGYVGCFLYFEDGYC